MAKIIIEVLAKDLGEVLNNLKMSSDFTDDVKYTLELGISDTKSNFEYLSKSDKILNWDFSSQVNLEEDHKSGLAGLLDNDQRALDIYRFFCHDNFKNDKDNFLKLIYLTWKMKNQSPGRLFTLLTLNQQNHTVNIELDYSTIDMATINNFNDYCSGKIFELILEDIVFKLSRIWNRLNEISDFNNVIVELLKY